MAIEATGVENVMEEVAHFWQLRKFQFIEEATDFWMDAVAPKECLGDEDPNLRKSSSSSPSHFVSTLRSAFQRYRKPSSSSPRLKRSCHDQCFGDTVIQVVVHHAAMGNTLTLSFGGTIN